MWFRPRIAQECLSCDVAAAHAGPQPWAVTPRMAQEARGYSALLLSQDLLSVTLLILPCPAKPFLSCLFFGVKLKVLRYGERSLIWVWAMVNYNYAHMTFLL